MIQESSPREVLYVDSIHTDRAGRNTECAIDYSQKRAFPASTRPDDGDALARLDGEGDLLQRNPRVPPSSDIS
jgi:hypothetical protein